MADKKNKLNMELIPQVKIDNTIIGTATRYQRNDVFSVIAGYGGKESNPLPGYNIDIDLSKIKDGTRKVTVNLLSGKTKEVLVSQTININIKKYNGTINIETPMQNASLKDDFDITGWEMSETIATVKLYVDGSDFSNLVKRIERQDVLDAIKNYGGKDVNPTPGFTATIPSKKLKPGTHQIKIQTISDLGDIHSSNIDEELSKLSKKELQYRLKFEETDPEIIKKIKKLLNE